MKKWLEGQEQFPHIYLPNHFSVFTASSRAARFPPADPRAPKFTPASLRRKHTYLVLESTQTSSLTNVPQILFYDTTLQKDPVSVPDPLKKEESFLERTLRCHVH